MIREGCPSTMSKCTLLILEDGRMSMGSANARLDTLTMEFNGTAPRVIHPQAIAWSATITREAQHSISHNSPAPHAQTDIILQAHHACLVQLPSPDVLTVLWMPASAITATRLLIISWTRRHVWLVPLKAVLTVPP